MNKSNFRGTIDTEHRDTHSMASRVPTSVKGELARGFLTALRRDGHFDVSPSTAWMVDSDIC